MLKNFYIKQGKFDRFLSIFLIFLRAFEIKHTIFKAQGLSNLN